MATSLGSDGTWKDIFINDHAHSRINDFFVKVITNANFENWKKEDGEIKFQDVL